ncbi:hypothetical protein HELRODRAFT_167974 [Helobdella robusta]|uniref:CUB domain-containing protein n=1 Tax=Helobdella robusta TaxID=6412 RepID=T1F009_HELRO|nr:hypothetical protein HELRODRAFT_167974 [Helobdella robusta]ESO10115.1 hypothetical protein HELRODRAFT_167974 [Helobdella robusta]
MVIILKSPPYPMEWHERTSSPASFQLYYESVGSHQTSEMRVQYLFNIIFNLGCIGFYQSETGNLSTPSYPVYYKNNLDCQWFISVTNGKRILLTIIDIHMEQEGECKYDYLQILNGGELDGPEIANLCHIQNTSQAITSSGNSLVVRFKSDESNSGKGFYANWSTVDEGCGGDFSAKKADLGTIDLTNQRNIECLWSISVSKGSLVNLTFNDVDLGPRLSCSQNNLKISTTSDFSQSTVTLCSIVSKESRLFESDRIWMKLKYRQGGRIFKVSYETGCGGTVNVDEPGELASPGWPNTYDSNLNCRWILKSSFLDAKISIVFTHVDLENEPCVHDFIRVHNSWQRWNESLLQQICGVNLPPMITSDSNVLAVTFVTDASSEGRGFTLNYFSSLSACGGNLTSHRGFVNSPQYPSNYPTKAECVWYITALDESLIELSFNDLQLDVVDEKCSGDRIEVVADGLPTILCRPDSLPITSHKSMTIRFLSNSNRTAKGFSAQYKFIHGGDVRQYSGKIFSPNYPLLYFTYMDVVWKIYAPPLFYIHIWFSSFELEARDNYNDQCYDYLQLNDGPKACATTPPEFTNDTNEVTVRFFSDRSNVYKGFVLNYKREYASPDKIQIGQYNNDSLCERSVLIESFKESITITSPNYPNPYNKNSLCIWTIVSKVGFIRLNFDYINVELNKDLIQIYSVKRTGKELVMSMCSSRDCLKRKQVYVSSDKAEIRFQTDNDIELDGFYMTASATCGGLYSRERDTIIHPADDQVQSDECLWYISVPQTSGLNLQFHYFNVGAKMTNCSSSSRLEIYRELDVHYTVPDMFCGDNAIVSYLGTNQLVIRLVQINGNITESKFKLTYHPMSLACGRHETIYPENPTYNIAWSSLNQPDSTLDCIWVLTSKNFSTIVLNFNSEFHVPSSSNSTCDTDFIEVRDGPSESSTVLIKSCGDSIPPPLVTTENSPCGSVFRDNFHAISSPNYLNVSCQWKIILSEDRFIKISAEFVNNSYDERVILKEGAANGSIFGEYHEGKNDVFVSSSNVVFVQFTSHSNVTSNFKLLYSSEKQSCGGTLEMEKGVFTSPGYPQGTNRAVMCKWQIIAPEALFIPHLISTLHSTSDQHSSFHTKDNFSSDANRVTLYTKSYSKIFVVKYKSPTGFVGSLNDQKEKCKLHSQNKSKSILLNITDFHLTPLLYSMGFDQYMQVFNGLYADSPIFYRGHFLDNNIFRSSSNTMTVVFKSVFKISGRGFKAFYTTYDDSVCHLGHNKVLGNIVTRRLDGSLGYEKQTECSWIIYNSIDSSNSSMTFQFNTLSIERDGECTMDYVQFHEGTRPTDLSIGKFCSMDQLDKDLPAISSASRSVLIRFHQTFYNNFQVGLNITYRSYPCGGIITRSTTITTPLTMGWDCLWHVKADRENVIKV